MSNTLFGEPCPDTHKYVEVHYTCEPLISQSTTSHAIPPWLLDLSATPQPRRHPASKQTTATTTTTVTTTTTTTQSTTASPSTTERLPEEVVSKSQDNLLVLETMINHCPPETTRNLFWNWTSAGELAIQPCPGGSSGFAKWRCGSDSGWFSASPDLGECQSHWVTRLEQRLSKEGDVLGVAEELADGSQHKTIYGGDLAMVTQLLQSLAHKARQDLFSMIRQEDKENTARRLVEATLKVGSNLLTNEQMLAWSDLEPVERAQVGSNLVLAIQENSFFLADTINTEKNIIMMEENLLSSVRIMRARDMYNQEFMSRDGNVHLNVPAESLIENSENGAVRLVFFHYNNLDHVLPSSTNGIKFLNSHIASASLSKGHATLLSSPLTARFDHLQGEGMDSPSCVWWDYVSRTWSEEGCWVLTTNSSQTTCQCSHLGNLAVVMQEASLYAAPHSIEETPSTMTVIIAAIVSIVICAVTVAATFIIFRRFSKGVCKNKIPCLEAKESTPGYYPYLSSSNTSTTITATTPDKNTGSQYFLNNECQVLRPLMITPLGPNSTIYRATFANGQQAHVIPIDSDQSDGANKYQFRPITPSASHIYMEIDPVYNSETMSDILVSDTSDDDLKRSSADQSRRLLHSNQVSRCESSGDFNSRRLDSGLVMPHHQPGTLAHGVHGVSHGMPRQPPAPWSWTNTGPRQAPQSLAGLHTNNIHTVFQ